MHKFVNQIGIVVSTGCIHMRFGQVLHVTACHGERGVWVADDLLLG